MITTKQIQNQINIQLIQKLNAPDLTTLCSIAESTMLDTYGFSIGSKKWHPPMTRDLEEYFSGVMLIPERKLIVGRIGKNMVGSLQLLRPNKLNKISNFAVSIHDLFVMRWARNSGVAEAMIKFTENYSRSQKYSLIKLSIRSDMAAAIALIEKLGYKRWGTLEKYETLGQEIVGGYFYCKDI